MEKEKTTQLTIKDGALPEIAVSGGLPGLVKTLLNEVHLFDTFIAGTTHLADTSALDALGKGSILTLRRECNKFDDNAIMILSENNKVGYIPEKDNVIFARLMDAGKRLEAKVNDVEIKGSFHRVSIGIYLVDF